MGGLQDRWFSQDPGMPANGLGPSFPESERTKEATPREYSPGGQVDDVTGCCALSRASLHIQWLSLLVVCAYLRRPWGFAEGQALKAHAVTSPSGRT